MSCGFDKSAVAEALAYGHSDRNRSRERTAFAASFSG